MKSTLINMVAVLFGITLIASAGVGVVNMITVEPIAAAERAATVAALEQVLPPFDATTSELVTIDEMPITIYTATKDEAVAGYAVESMTKNGFAGVVRLMVGFTPDGQVFNVNVLAQSETPGLGTKMADAGNPLLGSIQGKRLEEMKLVDGKLAVRKDGGDVDALTAATISSRAYVDAINRAWMAYRNVAQGALLTDVASGASKTQASEAEPEKAGCACGKEQKCDGCTGDCGDKECQKADSGRVNKKECGRESRKVCGSERDNQGADAQEGGRNE